MNKLWVRLTLAFVAITLASVALVALLANAAAADQFSAYLSGQQAMNQATLADDLAAFYRRTGSWEGVDVVIGAASTGDASGMMGRGRGGQGGAGIGQMRGAAMAVTLADAAGTMVYGDRVGQALSSAERAQALPINVDGAIGGYLLMTSPRLTIFNQAQQAFIDQLQRNVIYAAVGAALIAAALGLVVSRALSTPLAGLSKAARTFARRDWTYRAPLQGTEETAAVALALNQMAESLQSAERHRRNMMADIAHELRTPVTVIQGNLRAMLDGVYPLEIGEVATLYDETLLLNRLIDDLRELALAEAGQLQLHLQATDVGALLRAAGERFTPLAEAQGVALSVAVADQALMAQADPDRLSQVLRILLVNALKYTPSGKSVALAVSLLQGDMESAESAGRRRSVNGKREGLSQPIRVTVTDTGAGISTDDLAHVFDRFYRGDKSRSRAGGGSGLGLAIARSLLEAMGGQIGVDSTWGQGSCFWFTLPTM